MKLFVFLLSVTASCTLFSQNIDLEDIWLKYKFYDRGNEKIDWSENSSIIKKQNDTLFSYLNPNSDLTKPLFNFKVLPDTLYEIDYKISPSKNYILVLCNSKRLYRRSSKSYCFIYSLLDNSYTTHTNEKVFNPSFSTYDNYLAYTKGNNLYKLDLEKKEETQLTHDGRWNNIINGRTDWVYEEEFGFTKAYEWLGTHHIAYLKFNESEVKTYDLQRWDRKLYPEFYSYKYPKVGEQNSKVQLILVDVNTGTEKIITTTNNTWEYIPKLMSTNVPGEFCFAKTNREQNKFELYTYNCYDNAPEAKLIYEESSDKYVEIPQGPFFNSKGFIIDSYKSGFKHLHFIFGNGKQEKDLTPGDFDVTEFLGLREEDQCVFFSAYYDNSYTQSFCVGKKGRIKKVVETNDWVSTSLSPDANFAQVTLSSLDSKSKSSFISLLDQKKSLKKVSIKDTFLLKYNLGDTEFISINSENGYSIPVQVIYPPNFDSTQQYPLLMHCYGGPGHQVVVNKWNGFDYFYHQILAQKGCVVVLADGRGTDGNGREYRQASYKNFGKYEHEDQVIVAEYFRNKKFINKDKVGIWGWSFGGYLSSLCLLKSPDVFSMAIAVAPVTNWKYYDNIYTERYMGLLGDNMEGYDENSPTFYAKNLKGKFLLIHGTGDDNVHIQNSIFLQNELLRYNKQFETFYYPDKDHGIYGGSTRYNLYKKMTNFIEQNLIDNGN